ncbi:MAG TPA: carboxypeptidase M32 [Geminicoccaceae bacterium]
MSACRALEARFREIADIEGALAVLHWDQQVMMPPGGAEVRGEQVATLERIAHERLVDPAVGDWLAAAAGEGQDPWRAANLREMRRHHLHAVAVPPDLVAALARAAARAEQAWRRARAEADFALMEPGLREVLALVREKARAKAEALGLDLYDALLDGFEPGMRTATVDRLFEPLEARLPHLLEQVLERQGDAPPPLPGALPVGEQKALGERLMERLGFDFTRGRLDESLHPFCGGVPDDIRLTARYDHDVASGLMAILHETGHALYNGALPREWRGQPVGEARSTAVHESQSLLIEMQVCRSLPFQHLLAPRLQAAYGDPDHPALAPGALYRRAIRVGRGLIRVDADEVTYPLHVILRYRLERAMIEGRLEVLDLPEAWNEGMAALVGAVPPNDAQGCLQDIHWPGGAFGYFPCYTLGALMAAQLAAAIRRAIPDLDEQIAAGDFAPLRHWLREQIHERGCLLETGDLLLEATGEELSATPFLDHLCARYLNS